MLMINGCFATLAAQLSQGRFATNCRFDLLLAFSFYAWTSTDLMIILANFVDFMGGDTCFAVIFIQGLL
jgi:hypothetical protein